MRVRCPYGRHDHEGPIDLVVGGVERCRDEYFSLYGQLLPLDCTVRRMSRQDVVAMCVAGDKDG